MYGYGSFTRPGYPDPTDYGDDLGTGGNNSSGGGGDDPPPEDPILVKIIKIAVAIYILVGIIFLFVSPIVTLWMILAPLCLLVISFALFGGV